MKFRYLINTTLLALALSLMSLNARATVFHYKADVKGMVCAFCVYTVSKNIRKLPGVDADTVNVSLAKSSAEFSSKQKISQRKLTELFSQSGFELTNLTIKKTASQQVKSLNQPRLDLKVDVFETELFTWVLQAIGDIAVKTPSMLIVEAPAEQEETVLKALLMGRKQVIQVRFKVDDTLDLMHLQLFSQQN